MLGAELPKQTLGRRKTASAISPKNEDLCAAIIDNKGLFVIVIEQILGTLGGGTSTSYISSERAPLGNVCTAST